MSPVKVKVTQLTVLGGTVLRQDFREIWVSGISEVSGVTGDGEREQAVTEEDDMVALAKGKGGLRCGITTLDQLDVSTNPNLSSHRPELEVERPSLGGFSDSKYSVGYRGCVVVVSAEFALVAIVEENHVWLPRAPASDPALLQP